MGLVFFFRFEGLAAVLAPVDIVQWFEHPVVYSWNQVHVIFNEFGDNLAIYVIDLTTCAIPDMISHVAYSVLHEFHSCAALVLWSFQRICRILGTRYSCQSRNKLYKKNLKCQDVILFEDNRKSVRLFFTCLACIYSAMNSWLFSKLRRGTWSEIRPDRIHGNLYAMIQSGGVLLWQIHGVRLHDRRYIGRASW